MYLKLPSESRICITPLDHPPVCPPWGPVCIHSTLTNDWADGDTLIPLPGELLAYVVTGVNTTDETSSGNPPRTLASPCGAP